MKNELPERINYLKYLIEKLDAFDPESLGDDNPDAMDIVESAIQERLKSVNFSEADSTTYYVLGVIEGLIVYGKPADLSN